MDDLISQKFNINEMRNVFDYLDTREETRDDYKKRIEIFYQFILKNGFDVNTFLNFKRELSDRGDLSVSTKNKYLITARIFLRELSKRGMIPDITLNIKGFSQDKKHKKEGITKNEMTKLFDDLAGKNKSERLDRIKAIISLLTFQGLRQVEIIRLDVSDVDLISGRAFIRGKGRDDKESIFLHKETIRILRDYIKSNNRKSGALFVSQSNNSKDKRITTRGIRNIIKELLRSLDIEKSTHSFRHYFTTILIENMKGDLLEVAKYTRHKGIEMLQVYNDNIESKKSLPKYIKAFSGLSLN